MTDQKLIERYIETDPFHPGPSGVRLRPYGVSVWILIAFLEAVNGDRDQAAAAYDLPREAVDAAAAYYHCHQGSIDARIADHDAAFA